MSENNNQIHITINGQSIDVRENMTILQAAEENGITIPTLCFLKEVSNIGSCRMCIVEADGYPGFLAACRTMVRDGMTIRTNTDRVENTRRELLKLILADHDFECSSCVANGACDLQILCENYGIDHAESKGVRSELKNEMIYVQDNPFICYDESKCIHCQRCVNACHNMAGNGTLINARTGNFHLLETPFGANYKQTGCESCGVCTWACPTGALTRKRQKNYSSEEAKRILTTCPHCATGCQFYLVVNKDHIVDIEPADGPANHSRLCVKGRMGSFDFVHAGDRLTKPLIRDVRSEDFREVEWDEAISFTAKKLLEIKEKYGRESLAGFASSRSTNEDVYMVQKMVRTCFGNNNTDNCARVCHSATVAGLAQTLGSGAMTNPIGDITDDVDVILLVGSNPEEAHPVVGMQIRRAVEKGARLIVVDPRKIGLSSRADIHIALRPGTNVAFANGMMHVMIRENLIDHDFIREHTEGFEEIEQLVKDYTPERVGEICQIDPALLREAARLYAKADKAPIIYCLGVTEHSTGTEGVMSLSNIALLCGKIGKSGCGINPLRGQNNVQGACDMGALSTDYPGYQKVDDPKVREKFEKTWGCELNPHPGLKATEVFPAAIEGTIKGLYICGEDPVVSEPDTSHILQALEKLDLLVIQDLFMTSTARYADVILPAVSYAEKEGTFTNTERRVQRVRKAITLPGDMRTDTDIIIDIMNAMGYPQKKLSSSEIMDEIASLTPSYHGISHARLDAEGGLQWPCPDTGHPGTPILHVGHPTRGKGLFYPAQYKPSNELPDDDYPLILMTGRILYHYNAASITGRSEGLMDISGEGYIEINEKDAVRRSISDGDTVTVKSRRGAITTKARVGQKVNSGETWMPFHFSDSPVNQITNPALDDIARIPEYKVCAVQVEKLA